jgi:hypothetical protein
MGKITLHVDDKNLDTLLHIVQNLKEGLVQKIEVEKKKRYNTPKSIQSQPVQSAQPVQLSSKYVDPQTFKERLKRMKNGC